MCVCVCVCVSVCVCVCVCVGVCVWVGVCVFGRGREGGLSYCWFDTFAMKVIGSQQSLREIVPLSHSPGEEYILPVVCPANEPLESLCVNSLDLARDWQSAIS